MANGRYKIYHFGRVITNDTSTKADQDDREKDTRAYIRLLKHAGQWKSVDQVTGGNEEQEQELEVSTHSTSGNGES